jgi:hypothetical protein
VHAAEPTVRFRRVSPHPDFRLSGGPDRQTSRHCRPT